MVKEAQTLADIGTILANATPGSGILTRSLQNDQGEVVTVTDEASPTRQELLDISRNLHAQLVEAVGDEQIATEADSVTATGSQDTIAGESSTDTVSGAANGEDTVNGQDTISA